MGKEEEINLELEDLVERVLIIMNEKGKEISIVEGPKTDNKIEEIKLGDEVIACTYLDKNNQGEKYTILGKIVSSEFYKAFKNRVDGLK